jgi:hypothetical protein
MNPVAIPANTPALPTEQQPLIHSSPPSEAETPPLATVEEGEPVGGGSGCDDETNQTSAKAGEEQCMSDDDEEAAEMARLLEGSDSDESKDSDDRSGSDEPKYSDDSSGSDVPKYSDDSSGDWGDVQVVPVTRTDSW